MARYSIRLVRILCAIAALALTMPVSADDALPGLAANEPLLQRPLAGRLLSVPHLLADRPCDARS